MVTVHVFDQSQLEPRTEWTGGRISEIDMVSLAEAAQMASKHAGQAITVNDFLRAGGRGEIRIHADCPRTATFHPCRATDKTIEMPKGHFARLPFDACRIMAIRGVADWRTREGFEIGEPGSFFEGERIRFDRWMLADGEESLTTTVAECLVIGRDVHAFADAFLDSTDHKNNDAVKPVLASDAACLTPEKLNGTVCPKQRIREEAREEWIRQLASNCNPTVNSMSENMARWCVKNEVRTSGGVNPRAGTIRNTILGAGHWQPPTMSRDKAKEHVAQRAQIAQP